jgi:hypothetical protein
VSGNVLHKATMASAEMLYLSAQINLYPARCQRRRHSRPGAGERSRICSPRRSAVDAMGRAAARALVDLRSRQCPVRNSPLWSACRCRLKGPLWRVGHAYRHLAWLRQHVIEVPTPARRIVSFPEAPNGHPVENSLNPAAKARRGLGLGSPDRVQHLHYQSNVNRLNRDVAEDGIHRITVCRTLQDSGEQGFGGGGVRYTSVGYRLAPSPNLRKSQAPPSIHV